MIMSRQMLEIVADSKKASTLNRQMRAVLAQSEDSEQNPSPEAVSIIPVTSTHDPKSEQNARIICITCETPVAQASDLMMCTVRQGARHRGCDWDIEEDVTVPSDGYVCDNCLLNASERTYTNRVENLYRLLAIMPPNETTAQKQEEALEKKELQQIVALKSLVAELEAKIKTLEEKNRLLKTRIPAQQVRNEPTTAKTCQDTLTTQLLPTITSLTETMATLTFRGGCSN